MPVRRTSVDITESLAEHLRILGGDPDPGHRLAAGLSQLGRDLAVAVPSCLAVSIVLVRLGGEITVSALARTADPAAVLASLAVPLSAGEPGGLLVMRAGEAGAFLLLADDLDGLLGPDHPPIDVDQHLTLPPVGTGESLAAALADLRAVNQGIGVLLDRGLPPEAARRELQRRAQDTNTSVGVASRVLLASLLPRAGSC
jgi:hypothetical protein